MPGGVIGRSALSNDGLADLIVCKLGRLESPRRESDKDSQGECYQSHVIPSAVLADRNGSLAAP